MKSTFTVSCTVLVQEVTNVPEYYSYELELFAIGRHLSSPQRSKIVMSHETT
jgi:hypothetical protein